MAKFYGAIGFGKQTKTAPGVYDDVITEHNYYGDVLRNTRKAQTTDQVNDNITISNEISIVADPFANENFPEIRYAVWMGTKWKITNVDIKYPRLILTVGGVYNAQSS